MALIALDARKYFDFGIGTYIQGLVAGYMKFQSRHKFLLYVADEDVDRIPVPDTFEVVPVPYKKYSLSEIFMFGHRIRHSSADIVHIPHYTLPARVGKPTVVTIHDLIHLRFPEYFNVVQRAYSRGMISYALRRANVIITDSEFTRRDLLMQFRANEEKIVVVHLGVDGGYKPVTDSQCLQEFRSRFSLDRPYILFVGNPKPHKGIDTLLSAFSIVRSSMKDIDLVLIGGALSTDEGILRLADDERLRGFVKVLGKVSEKDLLFAYNAASVFVLPSRYEGFGLPALEAMACGTPVVVSNAGSLPEILGDAASFFETGNEKMLADSILTVLRDSATASDLRERGKANALRFRWETAAHKTIKIYESLL